jgi:hypothetical protein
MYEGEQGEKEPMMPQQTREHYCGENDGRNGSCFKYLPVHCHEQVCLIPL